MAAAATATKVWEVSGSSVRGYWDSESDQTTVVVPGFFKDSTVTLSKSFASAEEAQKFFDTYAPLVFKSWYGLVKEVEMFPTARLNLRIVLNGGESKNVTVCYSDIVHSLKHLLIAAGKFVHSFTVNGEGVDEWEYIGRTTIPLSGTVRASYVRGGAITTDGTCPDCRKALRKRKITHQG